MSRRPQGYTLAEMLAVCAVLSIASVVALPSAQPVAEFRADTAAGEVVLALRFAREEALRTGTWRRFSCEAQLNQIRVAGLDTSGANVDEYTIPHPGSRAAYAVQLNAAPSGSNISLAGCNFVFADGTTAATVAFDEAGNPVRGTGTAVERAGVLKAGTVLLGAGNVTRTIAVDVTGRVTTS
jgi:prepilin-type N-terminal cleavage/methylation domain-containing protein